MKLVREQSDHFEFLTTLDFAPFFHIVIDLEMAVLEQIDLEDIDLPHIFPEEFDM